MYFFSCCLICEFQEVNDILLGFFGFWADFGKNSFCLKCIRVEICSLIVVIVAVAVVEA